MYCCRVHIMSLHHLKHDEPVWEVGGGGGGALRVVEFGYVCVCIYLNMCVCACIYMCVCVCVIVCVSE